MSSLPFSSEKNIPNVISCQDGRGGAATADPAATVPLAPHRAPQRGHGAGGGHSGAGHQTTQVGAIFFFNRNNCLFHYYCHQPFQS
jgi:hypothetical protein